MDPSPAQGAHVKSFVTPVILILFWCVNVREFCQKFQSDGLGFICLKQHIVKNLYKGKLYLIKWKQ